MAAWFLLYGYDCLQAESFLFTQLYKSLTFKTLSVLVDGGHWKDPFVSCDKSIDEGLNGSWSSAEEVAGKAAALHR